MNYDLCDILNRKMEANFSYLPENLPKSKFKDQNFLDNYLKNNYEDFYLELLENENLNDTYGVWIYRNGKISDQIIDFEHASKKITREIANLTFSLSPSLDIMYYSGVMKMIFSKNKGIFLETCTKPSLDQLLSIKDFQKTIDDVNANIFWRVCFKRSKNLFDKGIGLNPLFAYNFTRIK